MAKKKVSANPRDRKVIVISKKFEASEKDIKKLKESIVHVNK